MTRTLEKCGATPPPKIAALIVSIGRSEVLGEVLTAIRHQQVIDEVVLVAQAWDPPAELAVLCDRVIAVKSNVGFATANNRGLAAIEAPLVALINDDAMPEENWARSLLTELCRDSMVAAAQGVNVRASDPEIVDGCGIEWNCWLQAVQIAHGQPTGEAPTERREIFGVSATAALFRKSVLNEISDSSASPFDEGLGSYYEDVDLACRLRAAGHRALLVPSARVRHVGSATGQRLPMAGRDLIYSNRHLVLAKTLGSRYWRVLPRILTRDLIDGLQAILRGDWGTLKAIFAASVRVFRSLAEYCSWRPPAVDPDAFRRGRRQ